jgi:hypothetical protein
MIFFLALGVHDFELSVVIATAQPFPHTTYRLGGLSDFKPGSVFAPIKCVSLLLLITALLPGAESMQTDFNFSPCKFVALKIIDYVFKKKWLHLP